VNVLCAKWSTTLLNAPAQLTPLATLPLAAGASSRSAETIVNVDVVESAQRVSARTLAQLMMTKRLVPVEKCALMATANTNVPLTTPAQR
jgi:hypothetical protein